MQKKKTIILIPAAGNGKRFADAGYDLPKPLIEITDRFNGNQIPMIVSAANDINKILNRTEDDKASTIIIVKQSHQAEYNILGRIQKYLNAEFILAPEQNELKHRGQAVDCLRAKDLFNNEQQLFIGACDNGISLIPKKFNDLVQDQRIDAVILTHCNNQAVVSIPEAYGWVMVEDSQAYPLIAKTISVKKPISNNPLTDNAIVGSFWFRNTNDFVIAAEAMIAADDKINDEFYVDQVMQYMLNMGKKVAVLKVDKYICYGTPQDYQEYQQTINYWLQFIRDEKPECL